MSTYEREGRRVFAFGLLVAAICLATALSDPSWIVRLVGWACLGVAVFFEACTAYDLWFRER